MALNLKQHSLAYVPPVAVHSQPRPDSFDARPVPSVLARILRVSTVTRLCESLDSASKSFPMPARFTRQSLSSWNPSQFKDCNSLETLPT